MTERNKLFRKRGHQATSSGSTRCVQGAGFRTMRTTSPLLSSLRAARHLILLINCAISHLVFINRGTDLRVCLYFGEKSDPNQITNHGIELSSEIAHSRSEGRNSRTRLSLHSLLIRSASSSPLSRHAMRSNLRFARSSTLSSLFLLQTSFHCLCLCLLLSCLGLSCLGPCPCPS